MPLETGQTIDGKYKVGRLIGEGGMGTVYEGENARIGRRVAIKVLHANVASMPEFAERFEREARAAARIGSPHVCDVLDLGDLPNGDRYIVMEFLDGVSFEDRIVDKGKLTPQELAPIAFELLEGLGTMHNARVVHRDLKPANVFLHKLPPGRGRGETVKILDFGVAKLLPFEGEVGTMTKTGSMMGTPLYMSPEQARGARDVDGRTDLYAASVMFYRALSGQLPYMADTLNELLFKIVLEDPKPLLELVADIDEAFAAIVHKGLARDVDQRFTSAREYQEEIAVWGKTQGRTSLQFALTLPSDPPPYLSAPRQSAAKPADSEPKAAAAVTGSSTAAGTPIAWSGDGRADVAAETKRSGRGAMSSSPDAEPKVESVEVESASRPGSGVSPVASTVVSASSPELPASQATTGPSADQMAREARDRSSAQRNKLVMAAAAAAVALFVGVGVVVARTTGGDSTTQGSTPPASAEPPTDSADPTPPPPPATAAEAVPAATATTTEPVDTAAPPPPTATTAPPPTPPATVAAITTPRPTATPQAVTTPKPDPTAKASAAPAATTTTPAAPASATIPKPASSTRKFRTTID